MIARAISNANDTDCVTSKPALTDPATVENWKRLVVFLVSSADVQAQIGGQHGETTGVHGGYRPRSVGESQLEAQTTDAGTSGSR